jgi:3-hydroxy-9,10-secoandrosta-1,3,5(10)-triene-9,17-dione monooxygenase reductase component
MSRGPAAAPVPAGADDATRVLRTAFGHFTTGVTIVTCVDGEGARVGLTVNSFSSLSLQPPLVLWSLRLKSPSLPAFQAADHFAINVLAQGQIALSRHFATPVADKFQQGEWSTGLGGVPVLAACTVSFECRRTVLQEVGDHVLFIGEVLRVVDSGAPPLVFQGGRYRSLGELI